MRMMIEIDDQLIEQAMRITAAPTKSALVDTALRLLLQTQKQAAVRQFRGKVEWEGDLQESRRARVDL